MGKIYDVMSKQKDIILIANSRGYIITNEGNIFIKDKEIKGSVSKRWYRTFSIRNLEKVSYPVMVQALFAKQMVCFT